MPDIASHQPDPPAPHGAGSAVGWLIGPVFLLLAAWFLRGPELLDDPRRAPVRVSSDDVTTAPLRRPIADPPMIIAGTYALRCNECHKLFPSLPETPRRLTEHRHIRLDHGLCDRCFNCHDDKQRNFLALAGGDRVPFAESARLCAECHGPTYRDWEKGMHGRTNGYWDASRGESRRLTCTECHDPHAPALPPMTALPGPDTIRTDVAPADAHRAAPESPLRRWSAAKAEPPPGGGR
jgi:hypothetical protein